MSEVDFNCDCEESSSYATLAALRRRMMIRLGYAAQADNPPPGMAILLDDFLQSAQKKLYTDPKNPELRTERFYRWTMTPGIRYYGLRDNDSETDFTDITCGKHLDAYQVRWVGLEDLNGAWLPMVKGIDPTLYTTSLQNGLPCLYEIRSCIEIFPAPSAAYKLWIKGNFGLDPFIADSDRPTVNDELVFLRALADAKAHYGKIDATATDGMAREMLRDVKAGMHQTARYVPGTRRLPPAIQPTMNAFIPNP
jgi:hypothetical protein